MFTTGLALAILSGGGFLLIYSKLPASIKAWMVKHPLITDIVACLFTYTLFGGTLAALFAAAILGIIVSLLLALLNHPVTGEAIELLAKRVKNLQKKVVDFIAAQVQKERHHVEQTA